MIWNEKSNNFLNISESSNEQGIVNKLCIKKINLYYFFQYCWEHIINISDQIQITCLTYINKKVVALKKLLEFQY